MKLHHLLVLCALLALVAYASATISEGSEGTEGTCCTCDGDCNPPFSECRDGRCLATEDAFIPGPRPPPPQGSECVTKDQCAAGQVCSFGYCVSAANPYNNDRLGDYCLHQEDCFSPELICVDLQCVYKNCPAVLGVAGSCCTADAQCTDISNGPLHCVAGRCENVNPAQIPGPRPPAPQGTECTSSFQCAAGEECWFGFCKPIGFNNNNANLGLYCLHQEDCFSADLICVDTQCVYKTCPVTPPPLDQTGECCSTDAQCTSTINGPLRCSAGRCVNVNPAQIPGPRPPTAQGTECASKYDCTSGNECWFGFCKPTGFSNNRAYQGFYCLRQEDCFDPDLICVDLQCVRKTCPV